MFDEDFVFVNSLTLLVKQLLFRLGFTLVARERLEDTIRSEKEVINCNYCRLGGIKPWLLKIHPNWKLKWCKLLWKLDAESLQCAYGIIELDVPESKKVNQHLLLKNLVRHLNSEEAEAREDGGLHFFQKLLGFLSKHLKLKRKQEMNLWWMNKAYL